MFFKIETKEQAEMLYHIAILNGYEVRDIAVKTKQRYTIDDSGSLVSAIPFESYFEMEILE